MFGSSPRGAQALILAPRSRLLDGRANIAREDIEHVAIAALAHRIMLKLRRAIRRNRRRAHCRARHQVGSRRESIAADHARGARFEPEYLRKLDRLVLGIKRARTVRAASARWAASRVSASSRKITRNMRPATICASSTGTRSRASTN